MKKNRRRIASLQPSVRAADLSIGAVLPARSAKATRVHTSRRWREKVRPAKLQRDPTCQACAFRGVVTAATEVDHWASIESGGAEWADENLVSLCKPCHSAKTRAEQTGSPLPQIVPSKPRTFTIA